MNNLKTVIAAIRSEKGEFTGENLGRVVEAIFADNGDQNITNAQVNDLVAGELKGIVSVPQLRGKAVSAGYYQKKTEAEKASEHGTSQTRKGDIVKALEIMLSLAPNSLESLGKAKKPELEKAVEALQTLNDRKTADSTK